MTPLRARRRKYLSEIVKIRNIDSRGLPNGKGGQRTADYDGIHQFAAAGAGGQTAAAGRIAKASKREEAQAVPSRTRICAVKEAVTDYLLPKYLELTLLEAFLESGSLRARDKARRDGKRDGQRAGNFEQAFADLSSRARQEAITNELIEIVSGAETRIE